MTGGSESVVEIVAGKVDRRESDIAGCPCQRGDALPLLALCVRLVDFKSDETLCSFLSSLLEVGFREKFPLCAVMYRRAQLQGVKLLVGL